MREGHRVSKVMYLLQGHMLSMGRDALRTIELSPKPWKHWWIDHGTTKVNNACSRTAILFLCNSSSYCSPPCKSLHVGVLLKASLSFKHLALPVSFFGEHWPMIRTVLISTPYAVICHDSRFKNFAKVHNSKQCHGRWTCKTNHLGNDCWNGFPSMHVKLYKHNSTGICHSKEDPNIST